MTAFGRRRAAFRRDRDRVYSHSSLRNARDGAARLEGVENALTTSRADSSQSRGNAAKVIRSYADFSPRSYSRPTRPSGSAARLEYAACPSCTTRDAVQVCPSSSLTRTVIRSRRALAGLANSSRLRPPLVDVE